MIKLLKIARKCAYRIYNLLSIADLLDLIFPCSCLCCNRPITGKGMCSQCLKSLSFTVGKVCFYCGVVLETDKDTCKACSIRPSKDLYKVRSLLEYDFASKKMVLSFKYRDRTDIALSLGHLMYKMFPELFEENDLIVPVPLHRKRLLRRLYNQSTFIARGFCKDHKDTKINQNILKRKNYTTQKGSSAKQRFLKTKDAFYVEANKKHLLKDKNILLIDDALVTGSTGISCARTLKRNGAKRVSLLVVSRT